MSDPSELAKVRPARWWRICRVALLLAFLSFAACSALSWWRFLGPGVTVRNYRQLKLGMTEKQVDSLLGPKTRQSDVKIVGFDGADWGPPSEWVGADLIVSVVFYNGNAMHIARAWRRPEGPKETLLAKIWRCFFPG